MKKHADIDIDLGDRDQALKLFPHVSAAMIEENNGKILKIRKHNTGVYFTDIPVEPMTGFSSIDYQEAEQRGYFKFDLLNMGVYNRVRDKDHLHELMAREPEWSRLWTDREFCEKIVHIGSHYDLICKLKPDSIPRMAMFLAVMRPAKSYLRTKSWREIGKEVWKKPEDDKYYFKKSHAVSYAVLVAVNINLEEES